MIINTKQDKLAGTQQSKLLQNIIKPWLLLKPNNSLTVLSKVKSITRRLILSCNEQSQDKQLRLFIEALHNNYIVSSQNELNETKTWFDLEW